MDAMHAMRAEVELAPPRPAAGATWRGVVVGVVALLAFLAHPLLGVGLVLFELVWFGRLAERTGRSHEFSSRVLHVAAATIGAVAVLAAALVLAA